MTEPQTDFRAKYEAIAADPAVQAALAPFKAAAAALDDPPFRGIIHMSVDDSPDDRDDFDYDAGEVPCCMASSMRGPRACTCWRPVYDLDQADPDLEAEPSTRTACCDDCAYRPDSPERAAGQYAELQDIAGDGSTFACHKGMRRVILWRHPDGRELPAGDGDYRPPMSGPVAFKADGSAADLCAGWNAHRRALLGADG